MTWSLQLMTIEPCPHAFAQSLIVSVLPVPAGPTAIVPAASATDRDIHKYARSVSDVSTRHTELPKYSKP